MPPRSRSASREARSLERRIMWACLAVFALIMGAASYELVGGMLGLAYTAAALGVAGYASWKLYQNLKRLARRSRA